MATVAVFGATGFVGATFVERLLEQGEHDVRPFIHRSGSAWRLSRRGLDLTSVDIRDAAAVRSALAGASHVVDCTLGPRDVMLGGLDNLLRESQAAGIERFVHLSSVAAWGDQEPGTVLTEGAAPSDRMQLYGKLKLEQDRRIQAACRAGLPSVLLAPPAITGPHSHFLLRVLDALRRDALALIDGGEIPCSLCDVRNVAYAMELALGCERADATRYLITDETEVSWRDLVQALLPLAEKTDMPPSITREEALAIAAPTRSSQRPSPVATLRALKRALATAESRRLLSGDPLLLEVYGFATQRLPVGVARWVRRKFGSSRPTEPIRAVAPRFDPYMLGVQTRAVRHRMEGAHEHLGYRPQLDFASSMAAFRRWEDHASGRGSDDWPLLRELWRTPQSGAAA